MTDTAEKLKRIFAKLKVSFLFYAPRLLKVQTVRGKITPFELNKPQRILHQIVEDIRKSRPVRLIALKARRMGFSTYFSGRYYHKVSWNGNRYATQVTHEPEATDALFKMVKRFYDLTPPEFKPETKYNNTRLLEFNNKAGTGLNSGFRVATAGKEDFGSGQLMHYVHLSEVSKWPQENTASLLTSILQCVPDDAAGGPYETEVVFESTAKGIGGEFYDRFWGARYRVWVTKQDDDGNPIIEETLNPNAEESNLFTSIFLPWFVFDEYQLEPPEKLVLSEEEYQERVQYGLTEAQLYWRRQTIANKCNSSVDIFRQEYPANPMEAFLGTGRPVFDNALLYRLINVADAPIVRYECLTSTGQWLAQPDGRLRVWKEPRPGVAYIISADVSEGLGDGDYSCADVIDHQTGEQMAQWHGKCRPDEFALILMALGKRYNTAWVGVERNNHGLTTVTWMFNEHYPRLYAEMVPEPPGPPRKRYGWATTSVTRPLVIDNLIREMAEGTHGIRCRETYEEMMSFKVQQNGRYEADKGRYDDRVMCIAIGKYLRQVIDLPVVRTDSRDKKRRIISMTKRPPKSGWT